MATYFADPFNALYQFQQALDVGSQSRIARAGFIQVGRASGWISDGQCGMKDLTWAHGGYPHEAMALAPPPYNADSGSTFRQRNRDSSDAPGHSRALFSSLSRNARA